APNVAPSVNAGNNISLTLPANSTTLTGVAVDADGTIVSYAWTKVSGPNTSALVSPSSATTVLNNLVQGTYVFRLTVTDDDGASASDDITVTVNAATAPANQAPHANAGTDITITLPTNSTALNGTATDADGSIASFAWTKVSGPNTFALVSPASASTVINNLVQGTYVFRLTVTDNNGATDTDDITVTVNAAPPPPNQSPFANAGNNITLTLPTNSTTLNGSGTDADGTITSYSWTRISGPTTFTIGNASAASTSLTNLVQGEYVFRLTVTDNNGATDTDNITVTVNAPAPNQAPVSNAGNDVLLHLPSNSASLTGTSSSDPDGTIATYSWTKVSGPANFTITSPNSANTTVTNLVQGVYVFRLTVTDNDGASSSDNVTVTVNQPPVANAGIDIVMTLPTNATTLNGSGSTDPDGSLNNYSWTRVSGPNTFTLANANGVNTSITNLVQGTYVFRLTVTDNRGATAFDEVRITVNPVPPPAPNQSPTARIANDVVLQMPVNYTELNGSGSSDPDGNIVFRNWRQVSGPTDAALTNAGNDIATVSNLVVGEYIFELTVRDDDGATSTATVKVIVKNKNNEAIYCGLYPNPASAMINMRYIDDRMGTFVLSIFDANNRFIWRESVSKDVITFQKQIDISNLKAGVYFLQINGPDNEKVIRKFVKY
ncbi:MAG TPA: PKD domain-containing protein, partial [Chitinophagaceae bacterium]|nr:PKD domain-containing protein [Chitinophagaceae bacterium]